jgi:GntR family transcriptional repressor for pyruvate dehydrogenase complex
MFDSFHFEKKGISTKFVDYIKDLIIQGKLLPGEKLPSEREMSQMTNVSRNTIRESYKILAALGYVEVKHGQGVFVADENSSLEQWAATFFIKNDQILELFEIRKLLETQSVKRAADRATKEQIEHLKEITSFPADRMTEDKMFIAKNDQDFHLSLAEISGNSVLIRIMYNLIDLLKESRENAMQIPGRPLKSLEEHQEIVKAIEKRDPVLAEKQMLKHLNSVENSFIYEMKEYS